MHNVLSTEVLGSRLDKNAFISFVFIILSHGQFLEKNAINILEFNYEIIAL